MCVFGGQTQLNLALNRVMAQDFIMLAHTLYYLPPTPGSDVPEAPAGVYGEQAGLRTAVVYWDAPEDNGSPITMYEVTYSRAGVNEGVVSTTGSPATTSVNINDLDTSSSYTFTVRAINSVGGGAQSETSVEVSHRSSKS